LMKEIEAKVGPYVIDPDTMAPVDVARTRYAAYILREKKPRLMTVHLISLDHMQHAQGPFSPEAKAILEQLDDRVAELEAAAKQAQPDIMICIVSDHGFARTDHSLNLMAALVEEGLITMKPGGTARQVADWKAYAKVDGGSAAILLKDPKDEATRAKVEKLLQRLASDPANGIARVLGPAEIAQFGGRSDAAFWVDMQTNYSAINADGALVRD